MGAWSPANEIAVDLGTANTLVYVRGEGIVLNEPSVVAIEKATGKVKGIGLEAKRMLGRTPDGVLAVRPLKDGVIADFDVTEKMLRYFIQKVNNRRWSKPRMVICVPSGITGVEQRAVQEAAEYAGARKENPNCLGPNVSPHLAWSNAPEGTRSYALYMSDPEGRLGLGVIHWVAYGIPASTSGFAEEIVKHM